MNNFALPKFKLSNDEEQTSESPKLNLSKVTRRSKGLYFRFIDYVYLYEFSDEHKYIASSNFESSVKLVDVRYDKDNSNTALDVHDSEFKMVEIIEFNDTYILSELMLIDTVNVEYWVVKDLANVFVKFTEYFWLNRVILEEVDKFLED
jgi:hypothetical protein